MGKPKIRFKGYTEDWEQRKVLDLLIQPITDGPHETPKLVEKGVPFISVDAIVDNKIDFNRKRGNISEEYDELCCKKYKPQFHDVYLVKSGSTVGKVAIVETTDRFNIWSPLAAMRCGEKTYPYFLYDLLQTKDLQAQVADKASNGTQPNLSMRELEKFPVSVPSNLEEQKKIGDYFRSLDHLITLHQRKCDQAKKLKKYMLQKMFPKNNKSVPEIRFEGFSNDWEQRSLGEFIKNVAKKNKENLDLEPYAVTNDRGFIAQRDAHDDFGYMSNVDRTAYNIVPPNSFAYNPARINVGSLGYYAGRENVIVSSLYEVFQTEKKIDDKFLWHWLRSDAFPKWIEKLQEGSVRLYFYYDKLIQCQMMVSTTEEQKKIGEYLDSLDHLITLHQWKSYFTKSSYLLQKSLISQRQKREFLKTLFFRRSFHKVLTLLVIIFGLFFH